MKKNRKINIVNPLNVVEEQVNQSYLLKSSFSGNKKLNTQNSLEKTISTILEIYDSLDNAKDLFLESKKRLKNLKERSENNQVRIAIVGITSSGKSTLLNKILGENLLPTRVGPSSGIQVLCSYGKSKKAEIYFKDETVKIFEEDIKDALSKYGDEKNNPSNKEGVTEMRLFTNTFKFPKNLVFLDTPGLDAYNLESHEKITLQNVIPTVDMLMFLTTVKPDSDKINLDFIDKITTDTKPLVIVQNKIDSIEPKVGKGGEILKTVSDIRKEVFDRLKKLVNTTKKVKNAPIIQVSARYEKWEETNLEELKKVLSQLLLDNNKYREAKYFEQLNKELNNIVSMLDSKVSNAENLQYLFEKEKEELKSIYDQIVAVINELHDHNYVIDEYKTKIIELEQLALLYLEDNYKYDRKPKTLNSEATSKKDNLYATIRNAVNRFSNDMLSIRNKIKNICSPLNLMEEQIVRTRLSTSAPSVDFSARDTKEEYYYYKRKQSGLWGGLKRFVDIGGNNWGYDEGKTRKEVECVNIDKLLLNIKDGVAKNINFITDNENIFTADMNYAIKELLDAYKSKQIDCEIKYSSDVQIDVANGQIVLKKLKNILNGNLHIIDKFNEIILKEHKYIENLKEKKVLEEYNPPDSLFYNLILLAQSLALNPHKDFVNDIIRNLNSNEYCIGGWNINAGQQFSDIFFEKQTPVFDFNKNNINFPKVTKNFLLFLIVNSDQTGHYENNLNKDNEVTNFINKVAENAKIVWVLDSVEGLLHDDNLVESFIEIIKIAKRYLKNKEIYKFMVCSRDLYYTILLNTLYFDIKQLKLIPAQQEFIQNMKKRFNLDSNRDNLTGDYIRKFINNYL